MEDIIDFLKLQKIPVFLPGEEDYERSVATGNLLFRFSRPDCVVQPESSAHVRTIVTEANAHNQKITIKCGGHSYAGYSSNENGGISLDLRRMNKVKLDMENKTVSVEAGAQWGHVYKTLVNGGHRGWVVNGGRCPFVGVGGFLLGGGLGPFSRQFGMGCDTMEEATIVTADGKMVTVTENDVPKKVDKKDAQGNVISWERSTPFEKWSDKGKLFWALCGAGGGNYGVVVKMKLKVLELQGKFVMAGKHTWSPKLPDLVDVKDPSKKYKTPKDDEMNVDAFLDTMNNFYTAKWSKFMTIDSTFICDLRLTTPFGVRFTCYFDGVQDGSDRKAFDDEINEKLKGPTVSNELAKALIRKSLPEPSTRFLHESLVYQWSEETKKAFPANKEYQIYSSFIFNNDPATIKEATDLILQEMSKFKVFFNGEKVEFLVTFIHAGDETKEKGNERDASFFWREAVFQAYVTLAWEDKWMEKEMRGFLARFREQLWRLSLPKPQDIPESIWGIPTKFLPQLLLPSTTKGAYINFADISLKQTFHERAYFGENYKDLRLVKDIWDKENYFSWGHGVKPSNSAPSEYEELPEEDKFVMVTLDSPQNRSEKEVIAALTKDLKDQVKRASENEARWTDVTASKGWDNSAGLDWKQVLL